MEGAKRFAGVVEKGGENASAMVLHVGWDLVGTWLEILGPRFRRLD